MEHQLTGRPVRLCEVSRTQLWADIESWGPLAGRAGLEGASTDGNGHPASCPANLHQHPASSSQHSRKRAFAEYGIDSETHQTSIPEELSTSFGGLQFSSEPAPDFSRGRPVSLRLQTRNAAVPRILGPLPSDGLAPTSEIWQGVDELLADSRNLRLLHVEEANPMYPLSTALSHAAQAQQPQPQLPQQPQPPKQLRTSPSQPQPPLPHHQQQLAQFQQLSSQAQRSQQQQQHQQHHHHHQQHNWQAAQGVTGQLAAALHPQPQHHQSQHSQVYPKSHAPAAMSLSPGAPAATGARPAAPKPMDTASWTMPAPHHHPQYTGRVLDRSGSGADPPAACLTGAGSLSGAVVRAVEVSCFTATSSSSCRIQSPCSSQQGLPQLSAQGPPSGSGPFAINISGVSVSGAAGGGGGGATLLSCTSERPLEPYECAPSAASAALASAAAPAAAASYGFVSVPGWGVPQDLEIHMDEPPPAATPPPYLQPHRSHAPLAAHCCSLPQPATQMASATTQQGSPWLSPAAGPQPGGSSGGQQSLGGPTPSGGSFRAGVGVPYGESRTAAVAGAAGLVGGVPPVGGEARAGFGVAVAPTKLLRRSSPTIGDGGPGVQPVSLSLSHSRTASGVVSQPLSLGSGNMVRMHLEAFTQQQPPQQHPQQQQQHQHQQPPLPAQQLYEQQQQQQQQQYLFDSPQAKGGQPQALPPQQQHQQQQQLQAMLQGPAYLLQPPASLNHSPGRHHIQQQQQQQQQQTWPVSSLPAPPAPILGQLEAALSATCSSAMVAATAALPAGDLPHPHAHSHPHAPWQFPTDPSPQSQQQPQPGRQALSLAAPHLDLLSTTPDLRRQLLSSGSATGMSSLTEPQLYDRATSATATAVTACDNNGVGVSPGAAEAEDPQSTAPCDFAVAAAAAPALSEAAPGEEPQASASTGGGGGGGSGQDDFIESRPRGRTSAPSPAAITTRLQRAASLSTTTSGSAAAGGGTAAAAAREAVSAAAQPLPPISKAAQRAAAAAAAREAAGATKAGRPRQRTRTSSTLADVIRFNLIPPGPHQLLVGNQDLVDVNVQADGRIECAFGEFRSVSSLALAVLRQRNPNRMACDGWQEVKINGVRLDEHRQEAVRLLAQESAAAAGGC